MTWPQYPWSHNDQTQTTHSIHSDWLLIQKLVTHSVGEIIPVCQFKKLFSIVTIRRALHATHNPFPSRPIRTPVDLMNAWAVIYIKVQKEGTWVLRATGEFKYLRNLILRWSKLDRCSTFRALPLFSKVSHCILTQYILLQKWIQHSVQPLNGKNPHSVWSFKIKRLQIKYLISCQLLCPQIEGKVELKCKIR